MRKSERVKSLGGPGGLTCFCCGRSRVRGAKHNAKRLVKAARRTGRSAAIREGLDDKENS